MQGDDGKNPIGGTLFVGGGHVPLIGIFPAFAHLLGVGSREESVCLRQFAVGVAEYPGDRGELLLRIVGGENLVLAVLIELELYGTVKQPVPAYGFAGFQLVVDDHDVGVQQQDVAAILFSGVSPKPLATDSSTFAFLKFFCHIG